MPNKPNVLIENWLPIAELGVESRRESSTGLHPPLNRLHVWWARRPLTVSAAAVLASLLPQWSADLPRELLSKFPSEESYKAWFLRLLGILGDPVAGRKLLDWAKAKGITKQISPYGYKRAFTYNPEDVEIARQYDLSPRVVCLWKKQFLQRGPELFAHSKQDKQKDKRVDELEQLIGRQTIEIQFLKKVLSRLD